MPTIGFHASHEQIEPRALLEAVKLAQGFDGAYVHHVPLEQRGFLERVAPSILTAFSDRANAPVAAGVPA